MRTDIILVKGNIFHVQSPPGCWPEAIGRTRPGLGLACREYRCQWNVPEFDEEAVDKFQEMICEDMKKELVISLLLLDAFYTCVSIWHIWRQLFVIYV